MWTLFLSGKREAPKEKINSFEGSCCYACHVAQQGHRIEDYIEWANCGLSRPSLWITENRKVGQQAPKHPNKDPTRIYKNQLIPNKDLLKEAKVQQALVGNCGILVGVLVGPCRNLLTQ